MSFSSAPLTTVLGWCEKNNCSRIEITNLENNLVETLFVHKNYKVIIQINPTSFISKIEINKIFEDESEEFVFSQEEVLLGDCLQILETQVK